MISIKPNLINRIITNTSRRGCTNKIKMTIKLLERQEVKINFVVRLDKQLSSFKVNKNRKNTINH